VRRLRNLWPNFDFHRVDVGDGDAELPGDNDIISAMSVLLHIVDDDRFEYALVNLANALRPGGKLVLIEPVVVHSWWGPSFGPASNSKARPLDNYRTALATAGLQPRVLSPATVLLANVIDTRTIVAFRALSVYWDLLMRGVGPRERMGAWVAAMLGPADRLLSRLARTGPSAKVLIAERMQ
jgi:SAM-dependent methyltransferase